MADKHKHTSITEPKKREPMTYTRYKEEELYTANEINVKDWLDKGVEKYGKDMSNWKFKCPACGHVSSGQDFINAGDIADSVYKICIGRVNGKGVDGLKEKDKGHGCNWAAGGLFKTLGKGVIVCTPEHTKIDVFPFAD